MALFIYLTGFYETFFFGESIVRTSSRGTGLSKEKFCKSWQNPRYKRREVEMHRKKRQY